MFNLMVAHRGFSNVYPENTMLAMEKAVEEGCHAIEVDVRITRDDVLVLMHDSTVNRTTNSTGNISDMTWSQVSRLDAGSWKSAEFAGQRIPTFESILNRFRRENIFIVVEIKYDASYGMNMPYKIAEMILEKRMENQCLVMSFNFDVMHTIKKRYPSIQTGLLGSGSTTGVKETAVKNKHSFISWGHGSLNQNIVSDWKGMGLGVNAWTINDMTNLQRAYDLGVTMLTSNHCDMMVNFANQNSIIQSNKPPYWLRRGTVKTFKNEKWQKGNLKIYDGNKWDVGIPKV